MKRKNTDKVVSRKTFYKERPDNTPENDMDVLERAWNSLPEDITEDERAVFIEILERTIKLYNKCKRITAQDFSKEKN